MRFWHRRVPLGLAQRVLTSLRMKQLSVVALVALGAVVACGGTVETDSSKNAGVMGASARGTEADGGTDEDSVEGDGFDAPEDNVDDGVSDPGPPAGGAAPVEAPDAPVPDRRYAVAMTRAQIDALRASLPTDTGSVSSTGGGLPDLNADDLFLRVSDTSNTCSDPNVELACGGHWSLTIVLPPEYQAVGVYDLANGPISYYSSMTETGEPNSADPDDCGWGGGSIGEGIVQIFRIDADEIEFVVDLQSSIWNTDPSGGYTAERCP